MSDKFVKFLAYKGKVSVMCCDTKEFIEYVQKINNLTLTSTTAMGRFLTISAMMAHTEIKENTDKLTIQLNGNGPIGSLVSISRIEGKNAVVKGYIQNPSVELPLKSDGKIDVGNAVGRDGYLKIVKKNIITNKDYDGLVPLVSGEIAEDFTSYYANSLQKPTALSLGVLMEKEKIIASGGYIINLMPDVTDDIINKIEHSLKSAPSISKMFKENIGLKEMAEIITGDDKLEVLEDDLGVCYKCDCNKEKIKDALVLLGKEEVEKILKEDGRANIVCNFCNKSYDFSKEELEDIINKLK